MSPANTLRRELLTAFAVVFAGALAVAIMGVLMLYPTFDTPARAITYLSLLLAGDLLVFFVFGRWLVQTRVLYPLDRIVEEAEGIAEGDYGRRIPEGETREIGRLSASVNRMAERLFGRDGGALVDTPFGFPLVAGETTELDLPLAAGARVVEMRVVESAWDGHRAYLASLRDVTERKEAERSALELIREQAARAAAEDAAGRFRFLAECSTALASSLDYEATLAALPKLCVGGLSDWAVLYVVDDDGGEGLNSRLLFVPAAGSLPLLYTGRLLQGVVSGVVFSVANAWLPELAGLLHACVHAGASVGFVLPGGLGVKRRAAALHRTLTARGSSPRARAAR